MTRIKTENQRSSDTPSEIQLGQHGRYQIKSGRLSGEYVARAFPKSPTNARGMIAEAKGDTEEAAITALRDIIDKREIYRADERRADPITGLAVPSTDEFVEAVAQVALSRPQRAMLLALALADEEGLSEVRVSSAAGYKSTSSTNRALASAGLLIASYLSLEPTPEPEAVTNDHSGTRFLGYRGQQENDEDPGNWILHAELREAVRSAG